MSLAPELIGYLVFGTQLVLGGFVLYFLATKLGLDSDRFEQVSSLKSIISKYARELALMFALAATSGSLYFSEILGWTPCRLCWYQRIFMYPLVLVIGVGLIKEDQEVRDYVIPIALIGGAISVIHTFVQKFDGLDSPGCAADAVSCSAEHTLQMGYISVPVMALTAFTMILVLLWRFD